ncbi:hypothetical protein HXX76_002630 [Chlamydomonas incerta]|uniref:Uncharacterized protein n=1 Tax=Chlamydomonas incerta TaxID=51695 RepID=A0A835W959_CHLIN|nr:hypothetical protein HXX76_002630 [Chlamydomonas incerta]|eukprot:KAG2442544.1 hypothetical protein HXX76_002630 [Chlamydomonas incerta]
MGGTPDEVTQRWTDGEQAWCSLYSILRRKGCQLQLSPFSTSYISLRKTPNLGAVCRFEHDSRWSWWMAGSFGAAVVLLLAAGPLSESMALRVTSGGLIFALGSVVIITYIISRQVPGRRSLVTTAMLLGSTSWGLLRWSTGYWVPSLYTLAHNRVVLGVAGSFGLLGAALTYLYGNVDNPKINTLVKLGLQLLGLGLLWAGTWTQPPVFAALLLAAAGWRVLRWVLAAVRWFHGRRSAKQAAAQRAHARQEEQEQQHLLQEQQAAQPRTPLGAASAGIALSPLQSGGAYLITAGTLGAGSLAPSPYGPPGTPVQAAGLDVAAALADAVSPLVRAGLIINPLSGRSIKIGGDLYNRLVEQGHVPDMAAGRLAPPAPLVGSPAGSDSGTPGSPGAATRRRRQLRNRAG